MSSFAPNGFADRIRRDRYAFTPEETWEDGCRRVARHVSACEPLDRRLATEDRFYEELATNRFCPGGRIWYAAGRPKGQLANCYVVPTADSREGWGKTVSDMIVISGTGGGVGLNASNVRPRGSAINGHSGLATGPVSLFEIINAAGEVIRAGGGRRTALMLCLNHDHPDIPEFLDKKLDLHQLTNANVSVVFMNENPEAFLHKVDQNLPHTFYWNGEARGQVSARELWAKILNNAVQCGEPGILNGWLANQENNIGYVRPLVSTNPCGEQWLEPYGVCDLGALVLPRFVLRDRMNGANPSRTSAREAVDWPLLGRTIATAVRFLDDVTDVNVYPLKEIEENCKRFRRIGLGVMGLHDMLILLGYKYSSEAALEFVDELMGFIKNRAYEASMFLAAEKGQFPGLVRDKFLESGFCRRLKPRLREQIREHGIRNCAILTIAPTGTTSIVSMVTSGIEPMYTVAYRRRFRDGDALAEEVVEHPLFQELKGTDRAPLFESALEIPVQYHLAMQAMCQHHVDSAISKTINLPRNYTGQDLDIVLRKFIPLLKGCTLYRDGSRGEAPFEPLTWDEAAKLTAGSTETVTSDCPSGVCELG